MWRNNFHKSVAWSTAIIRFNSPIESHFKSQPCLPSFFPGQIYENFHFRFKQWLFDQWRRSTYSFRLAGLTFTSYWVSSDNPSLSTDFFILAFWHFPFFWKVIFKDEFLESRYSSLTVLYSDLSCCGISFIPWRRCPSPEARWYRRLPWCYLGKPNCRTFLFSELSKQLLCFRILFLQDRSKYWV